MRLNKKNTKFIFLILAFIVLLYFFIMLVLPNKIQYISSDVYCYDNCYYEKISDDDLLSRIENFNFYIDNHKVLCKNFPFIQTVKLAYDDNIIIADNFVFKEDYYLKRNVYLPTFEAENIKSLLIEYSDESGNNFILDDYESIDKFINDEMENYKGKNIYVTIEYKNYGGTEIISL